MATSPEARLDELGIELPEAPTPAGSYVPATRAGNLVFTAGQLPLEGGELNLQGKVGDAIVVDRAREAARLCALNALAAAATQTGGLAGISRIVKVTASSHRHPALAVSLRCSTEPRSSSARSSGKQACSAVGVAELPMDAPVEVELVVEAAPDA